MSKSARELRGLKSWLEVSRSESRRKSTQEAESAKPESDGIAGIFLPKQYGFEAGRDYEISQSDKLRTHDIMNPATGAGCVFRYEGKRGIHHYFREVRGGWTRTYTDNQLIGKRILEVE